MDYRLELVFVPVSDVDRAKAFYVDQVGFNADHDRWSAELRFVQLTPPGSACSIASAPASARTWRPAREGPAGVVDDVDAVRAELVGRASTVTEVERPPLGPFVYFGDPDGNTWARPAHPAPRLSSVTEAGRAQRPDLRGVARRLVSSSSTRSSPAINANATWPSGAVGVNERAAGAPIRPRR